MQKYNFVFLCVFKYLKNNNFNTDKRVSKKATTEMASVMYSNK